MSNSPAPADGVPRLPSPPLGRLGLGGQVEAGAERPPGPGQHDAAHVRVVVGLQQVAEMASSIGPEIVFMRSGALRVIVATWSATS